MIMVGAGAMHRIGVMLVAMICDIAFMVMGMGVSMLVRVRMRRAISMGVLMVVDMRVLMFMSIHGFPPSRTGLRFYTIISIW